jgi:hypothetical protein
MNMNALSNEKARLIRYYFYCTVLYCTALYCTVLYCIILYCIVLYCIVFYCAILYSIGLYCRLLCWYSNRQQHKRYCLIMHQINNRSSCIKLTIKTNKREATKRITRQTRNERHDDESLFGTGLVRLHNENAGKRGKERCKRLKFCDLKNLQASVTTRK